MIYISLAIFALVSFFAVSNKKSTAAVGYRSLWEPTLLLRFRFITSSSNIIQDGYNRLKNSSFIIKRLDSDLLVLSNKYLEELRLLPNSKLSNVHAQVKNMLGDYSYSTFLLHNDQHVRVLQNYLTPNLSTFLGRAREEMDYSFTQDIPRPDRFTEVDIQKVLQTMIARISSRVFVGRVTCRNEEWLKLCLEFPLNLFATTFIMRMFPPLLHPILALLLPTRYWLRRNLLDAERLLTPIIKDHQERGITQVLGQITTPEKADLLEWMVADSGPNADPKTLAQRILFLSLASIHSTSSAASNAIFDLCAHPEYIAPLREEIQTLLPDPKHCSKQDLNRLWKLDSFLKESQRFNPPILLSPQRVALTDIQLSDGTRISKGTSIAFPSAALLMDPNLVENPETFDGFRAHRKRMELRPGEVFRHSMVTTDKDHLYFGHGKQACPGRFFAANEIKMILIWFLLEFDFRLPQNSQGEARRPKTFTIDEMCFADPRAKIEMRVQSS
ncbi:cytochrome P450 [Polyplosphaeria fusca]|uniref:Cytochrome P450 n=1 Tax=Polyplosphaeria fusca TaxID=682080 RepID=A0A9P4R200_9PLEO|nr:cytochrome P450 [Polyplosphaeria fusca]